MDAIELKNRRLALGLTQEKLAELTGFNEKAISRWEAGKVKPMRANLQILETTLKELEAKNKS